MSEEKNLDEVWEQAREKLLERMDGFNRSLWDAATEATPLALDEGVFVLGMPPGKMSLGSHLNSTANGPMVRQCIEDALGESIELELIEGTDAGAWEREKQRRETRERVATQRRQAAQETAGARAIWSRLHTRIGEIFGSARDRRFPTMRAQMLAKALLALRDMEVEALEEDPDAEELHEQELNRNIDRIAGFAEVPATFVAVEYLRVRRAKKD